MGANIGPAPAGELHGGCGRAGSVFSSSILSSLIVSSLIFSSLIFEGESTGTVARLRQSTSTSAIRVPERVWVSKQHNFLVWFSFGKEVLDPNGNGCRPVGAVPIRRQA